MFSLGLYSTVCLITGGSLVPVLPDYHLSFIFLLFIPGWIFADSSPADDGSSDLMECIVTIGMVNVIHFSALFTFRLFLRLFRLHSTFLIQFFMIYNFAFGPVEIPHL